jgi:hypothetical protein
MSDDADHSADAAPATATADLPPALAGLLATVTEALRQLQREPLDLRARRHLRRAEQAARQAHALVSSPPVDRTEPAADDPSSVAVDADP